MAEKIKDLSPFFGDDNQNKKIQEVLDSTPNAIMACGWVPRSDLTKSQKEAHDEAVGEMPKFTLRGRFAADQRRVCLWQAGKTLLGKYLPYNWQQTGSCVGAGGGNMAKTAQAVDIIFRAEAEQYKELWWLYTYGRSRYLSGMGGQGEGSRGSGWAKAATTDGFFEIDPEGYPDLPDYKESGGWLVQTAANEMKWSNGKAIAQQWVELGRKHLFKTAAPIRNANDAYEAIAGAKTPLTIASMFGMRQMVPAVKGSKFPVRVGEWTGSWSHQMFIDEVWDHPELNTILFRIGNNWGPAAHGKVPMEDDAPPGGFYVTDKTLNRILSDRDSECYGFSGMDGFAVRELDLSPFN